MSNPYYPLFIPSKGRADTRYTAKYLDYMKVPYRLVIEPQEYKEYLSEIGDKKKLLVLDMSYKEKYELCDDLGLSKSTGPGPARNFAWDVSIAEGYKYHWVMDDNIRSFRRLNHNEKVKVTNGSIFAAMEEFAQRYTNLGMCGPNYTFFAPATQKRPPFVMNTRIYSCNLIKNDIPFRWRGRYNEDTDLSLRMMKDGWCTVQFNQFLTGKRATQTMRGGNSAEFYDEDGTKNKSQMLADMHPDVARVVWKWNRWHHHVDYSPYKNNKLIPKDDVVYEDYDEYGMKLVRR